MQQDCINQTTIHTFLRTAVKVQCSEDFTNGFYTGMGAMAFVVLVVILILAVLYFLMKIKQK